MENIFILIIPLKDKHLDSGDRLKHLKLIVLLSLIKL